MGYAGTQFRMPLVDTGFRDDRNTFLLPPTALLTPSKNVNYHEGGLSKRGGNEIFLAGPSGGAAGQGMIQFQTPSGAILVFATGGKVYQTNYSNVIESGLSTNFVSFVQTSKYLLWADGETPPQYWDGVAPNSTVVMTPSSWTGNQPFQLVNHSTAGASGARLWAVTPDSLWASGTDNPYDFSDAKVIQLPINTIGGLVGAADLGGQLFAFSRTQTFLINDQNPDIEFWGYTNALWEGGVASWRLIGHAYNNLFLMEDDGLIYSLQGIFATGSYMSASLNRPSYVDKYIRDNVTLANIKNFHVAYDRKLRALKWFMQSNSTIQNIALTYFIDKQPTSAWIVHDNDTYMSGYNATCSCEVRVAPGNYQVYTMDYQGNIWDLESTTRDDNGNPYNTIIKTKAQDLNAPRNNKHWMALVFRGQASGQVNFTIYVWIEGIIQATATFTLNGTGAEFDFAHFDVDVFPDDQIVSAPIYLGYYGRDCQIEIVNDAVGQDFFLGEILFMVKPLEIKLVI